MPYTSMDEVNPAIKGIDPPVTLAQANAIAEWADAMEEADDGPENPWAAAIAQFKKLYEVKGGKWVKKETDEERGLLRSLWDGIRQLFTPYLEPPERALGIGKMFAQLDAMLYESSDHGMAWLHDLYRDDDGSMFAIVSERGKLFRVPLAFEGDGVAMGEWLPVVEEFKPVEAARTRTSIIRQADGRHRWLSVSCTSVLNRVGEIDSRALFDSFAAHIEETGEYPYRTFFHQGEALRTGQADFLARDGDVFITSGLYDEDNPLAAAEVVARQNEPDRWGESIGYMPTAEPEMVEVSDGVAIPVYARGVLQEISTLPDDKAAAWFTATRTQEVRRMRKDVLEALTELLGGDEERAKEFAALVDGTNREIGEAGLLTREVEPEPAPEPGAEPAPEPAPEPGEIEREVVLDEAALALIGQHFAELLAPLTEKLEGLEAALGALAQGGERAREALGERVKALEASDEEKHRQWMADLPRRETLTVTHRPREANKPEGNVGEPEPAPDPSKILDAAGIPQYA